MQQKVKHRVPSRPTAGALRRPGAHQCVYGMNASDSTHLLLFLQFLSLLGLSQHLKSTLESDREGGFCVSDSYSRAVSRQLGLLEMERCFHWEL